MKPITRNVAFAFAFDESAPPLAPHRIAVSWSREAWQILRQIHGEALKRAREKDEDAFDNLPYARLRAEYELATGDWRSMQSDLDLDSSDFAKGPRTWGLLAGDTLAESQTALNYAFARWLEGSLARYCQARSVQTTGIVALRQLVLKNEVLVLSTSQAQVYPWSVRTSPGLLSPYDVTASLLASRLAGKEIFPGLGPMVRVIASDRNCAEVMTRPVRMAGGGEFSLVCAISLETLPGASLPLIYVQSIRRRWANTLKFDYSASPSISGYVFPHTDRPNQAFRFTVRRRAGTWTTDADYDHYVHAFRLTPDYHNARVVQYPSDAHAYVGVAVKSAVAETDSGLEAGVPLADRGDAFTAISSELTSLGLRPFTDFRPVKPVAIKAPPLAMKKAAVTLARLVAEQEAAGADNAPGQMTNRRFMASALAADPEAERIARAIQTLVQTTAWAEDTTRQTIYVISQNAEDVERIRTTAHFMLGNGVTVRSAALPPNTHGPQQALPLAEAKREHKQRFDARVNEWLRFAEAIGLPSRAMVLVQAKQFYDVEGNTKRDDWVNKFAARHALASRGCSVQYLLPSEPGREEAFQLRIQAALLDLVFGHGGSVWGLQQACEACFADSGAAPRWVAGISSVKVRTEWKTSRSVLMATRLDCTSGQAWVRFAHQDAEAIITPWMPFDDGLRYVAERHLELPRTNADSTALWDTFATQTLDDLAALDSGAVVFLAATRLNRWAKGLTDIGMSDLARQVVRGISTSTRWPTVRLLRIREQAPTLGQEKFYDRIDGDASPVRTWTSTQQLFKVEPAVLPTFWSLDRAVGHPKRGASCYREILLPNPKPSPQSPGPFAMYPARPDRQHMNPRALEIVVVQKQPGDDDVRLASFAQQLRAGMMTARVNQWVTTPTPLRIMEKFEEYMRA